MNLFCIGTVVKLREQPARILLLLSRCTALTPFGNQTTPPRARFGHAPSHLTTVLPHPAPGKMCFAQRSPSNSKNKKL